MAARKGAAAEIKKLSGSECWAIAADEKLEIGRYLNLCKRPEYKGKPRADVVTDGAQSRMLRLTPCTAYR